MYLFDGYSSINNNDSNLKWILKLYQYIVNNNNTAVTEFEWILKRYQVDNNNIDDTNFDDTAPVL